MIVVLATSFQACSIIRARWTTLCDKVCQWLVTGRWFSSFHPVSSTNKTDRHNVSEILLKVVSNKQNKQTHFRGTYVSKQWDAVMTHCGWMIVPPHVCAPVSWSDTCHGQLLGTASRPPTIRVLLSIGLNLCIPHILPFPVKKNTNILFSFIWEMIVVLWDCFRSGLYNYFTSSL